MKFKELKWRECEFNGTPYMLTATGVRHHFEISLVTGRHYNCYVYRGGIKIYDMGGSSPPNNEGKEILKEMCEEINIKEIKKWIIND